MRLTWKWFSKIVLTAHVCTLHIETYKVPETRMQNAALAQCGQ